MTFHAASWTQQGKRRLRVMRKQAEEYTWIYEIETEGHTKMESGKV